MALTFDPINKRIILDSTNVEVKEIYSRWKEWVQISDNSKWPQAFSVIGGDPLGNDLYVASYFFLMNGWRLRPMEQEQTLIITGNISVLGGGVPVVRTIGNFNVSIQFTVPVQAQGIATSGTSGPSASEIAAAVREELAMEMAKIAGLTFTLPGKVDANIEAVNALLVKGTGTEIDPWGPQ